MQNPHEFVAYFDLLGIGDASLDDDETLHECLNRFRSILCDAIDRFLIEPDCVYAFSDCAFATSKDLARLTSFVTRLQYGLWEHKIFLKGAISKGRHERFDFADLPGQSSSLTNKRKSKLSGSWFGKEFVQPALIEKNLKGIAIQVGDGVGDELWRQKNVCNSLYYPSDSAKRPSLIHDLIIPPTHLHALNDILKIYLLRSHESRRVCRYYVPLIITWIKSHDYSSIECKEKVKLVWVNAPIPLKQLIQNTKVANEVASLVGAEMIFYALLDIVARQCTVEFVTQHILGFIARNKKLRDAAASVPDVICRPEFRKMVIDSRMRGLFG